MTAKEYLKDIGMSEVFSESDLIEFAKIHVEAALKAVTKLDLDDVTVMPEANDFEEGRELHILNAYPLTNIK